MKLYGHIGLVFVFFLILSCDKKQTSNNSAKELHATIDIDQTQTPISRYLYGMFMENLGNDNVGNLVDDALWAELLDDRKFFYPVNNDTLNPINRKEKINRWRPMGNVVMDSAGSYVGVHSPKILASTEHENGIQQSGIAINKGKSYTGRIILKGSESVKVSVSLMAGSDKIQTIVFDRLDEDYKRFDFRFNSSIDDQKAKLVISGIGEGSFTIGAVSLMPSDNVDGFRADVIELLKELDSEIYRWGGNFVSGYDWRDGVGNPDLRPPRYEYAWNSLEDNDVGTHEIIRFAELIGVELSMTVNTGFGDAHSAAEWIEYCNGAPDTEMGKIRAANGHPEPFNIKMWCVGNESYGWWQLGHINLKNHIIKHNMFVDKMLEKDPDLVLIGSGASIEEMTITANAYLENNALSDQDVVQVAYDSADDWTGGMLREAKGLDYMSEHFYCAVDKRFDLEKGDYVDVDAPLVDWTRRPANRIKLKAEHYKEYHERIPSSRNVPIYLDEWAYYTDWVHPTPTLGVTIGYARALNEMFRHTDLYKMAGFTFATSCLSFTDTELDYNTTGLMFKLYKSQLGSIPVKIAGNSPQPEPKYAVGGDQPKEYAGGNLYPLDVVATLTKDKSALVFAIVNPTSEERTLNLDFGNSIFENKIEKWMMSGSSVDARNIVGQEPEVKIIQSEMDFTNTLKIEPVTINVIRYHLK
ncbi:hypothetical protein [Flagellimonas sp. GZD32]|uniref:hypothetical protein n=1 Tax=Flagellimonas cixiensis TaxID=3228750 RepID=UPI0035C8A653